MVLEGQVERGRFGTSVANLGDIDDDGYEGVCMYVYRVALCVRVYTMCMGKYG